ncbi:MAG TPA: Maf family protein [Candidatus Limnocylindrales bacterium]|nr:Maf family protein [Candidatus Limnocylindrales bacterium]
MAALVLASTSPRRIELLGRLGVSFETVDPATFEIPPIPMGPLRLARWAAREKAHAVARRRRDAVVLAADTVVALDGKAFGKPRDSADARRMLQALSGRTHQVVTAVHVVALARGCEAYGYSRTAVRMRVLSPSVIDAYVRTREVKDKAGAYAIQGGGARLVESIQGPFDNVVGLPLRLVARLLERCGLVVRRPPA